MAGSLRFIHHACFTLSAGGETAIFDPFLEGNPEGLAAKDIKADWVFITHAHGDHMADAFEIARNCGATVVTTNEVAALASENGCHAHGMHIGGTFLFPFGKVRVTPAFHGSGIAGGHACGFTVNFHGARLYYAGDTGVFGDMALLPKLDPFDVAVLPIGGNYTMDPDDAALAARMLGAKIVIPVHYNTWPIISQDPKAFKHKVEATTKSRVVILRPGETFAIP